MKNVSLKTLWGAVASMAITLLAACTETSDLNDVEELEKQGENLYKVGNVSTPIGECLDAYAETDGGVTHLLHFFTIGYYQMNGDGTCSENKSFRQAGAYVEIPLFDKGQGELTRLMTGTYLSHYSNTDDWSGEYCVTKGGTTTTKALVYDKMTDLQTSTVQVKKKGDVYEITWDGRDERGNVCSLYYYGKIRSEKMMDED